MVRRKELVLGFLQVTLCSKELYAYIVADL
jgi:hypothetical protein